jgi:hypothetical protein
VAGKEIVVKKYVVRLSAAERAQLDELIRKGKRAGQLLKRPRDVAGLIATFREAVATAPDAISRCRAALRLADGLRVWERCAAGRSAIVSFARPSTNDRGTRRVFRAPRQLAIQTNDQPRR